ncbi:expansin EXLX1 family cellulose-binding protein [Streptacidiphilus sp. N1-10]|uniref:Expansin EXLX1 family cellulose-binding protein n=1 Tax=Streptacidiphilus jeojiensis TaxID=3229225 RepID=A0ABV6XG30_9ACTN
MTATHRSTEHRGRHRGWLLGSVAVAALAALGVIASVALGSTPQRNVATGTAVVSTSAGPSTPAASAGAASTRAAATTTESSTARASAGAKPRASTPAAPSARSTPSAANSSQGSSSATAAQAGRIRPGVNYTGVATEYAADDGNGACLFGPSATMMIAAMNYTDYENSKACGDHILVRASNGATITVLITNECPLPCAPGQLDLSQQAFAKLADPSAGRISITWHLVSPSDSGTISFRYKTGSSQWWCGIQVIGERNPVAELDVRTASGGWTALTRMSYNYFLSPNGTGCGGEIRISDIYGQQLTASGIAIRPDAVQATQLQFAQH